MNVELEDGTMITDVPEGTTQTMLMTRVNKMRETSSDSRAFAGQDLTRGKSIMRGLGQGFGDTFYQAGQLMENVPGVRAAAEGVGKVLGLHPDTMRNITKAREQEYQASRGGDTSFDLSRLAGNITNPINLAAGVAGGVPATLGQAIKTGAQVGAIGGGLQPYTGEGNLAVETGKQAGVGAVAGAGTAGLLYGGAKTAQAVKNAAGEFGNYFTKEGYKPIAQRFLRQQIGKAQLPEVRSKLLNAQPILPARAPAPGAAGPTLPASPMTAAEAVSDISAGSPVQAMQRITYQTPGGPSKVGGDIHREALAAQVAAKAELNAATKPLREEVLARANLAGQAIPKLERVAARAEKALKVKMPKEVSSDQLKSAVELHAPYAPPKLKSGVEKVKEVLGGEARERATQDLSQAQQGLAQVAASGTEPLKIESINRGIRSSISQPGIRASDVASKTLTEVQEKLKSFADKRGIVDANDLYTIRKEIGNTIQKHAKENANWDKRMTAGLERDIQKSIDDAIEQAAGGGWKDYLAKYAEGASRIERDILSKEAMYKPLQKTVTQRGVNVASGGLPEGPTILWRPYTVAKWIPKIRSSVVEPRVDAYMAELMRNAPNLGHALEDAPVSQRNAIVQALINQGQMQAPMVAGMTAGRQ